MNALIIDDEINARESLRFLLTKHCPEINILNTGVSVEEGVQLILHMQPDIVFLDIEMSDGTGFDLLTQLKDINFQFIFVTAFNNYAVRAFQFSAVDYLLKPVNPTLLIQSVEKLKQVTSTHSPANQLKVLEDNIEKIEKIIIKTENETHTIQLSDIVRCQADNYYTIFILQNDTKIIASKTLKEYANILEELNFFRTHQSHLINLACVENHKFGNISYVYLNNGDKIELSRRRKKPFLEKITS